MLLDHGLYETISPDEREALCQLWKAIVLKDEAKMKQYSVALGVKGKRLYSPHTHSHTHTGRVSESSSDDECSLRLLAHDFLTFAFILSMRPIHRPIHEMAIAPDKWDKMSPEEQQTAHSEGKLRFPVSSLALLSHSCQSSSS